MYTGLMNNPFPLYGHFLDTVKRCKTTASLSSEVTMPATASHSLRSGTQFSIQSTWDISVSPFCWILSSFMTDFRASDPENSVIVRVLVCVCVNETQETEILM